VKMATILSHPWVTGLGLTLLHSLWQGGLIALALAVALRSGRTQTARWRYGWTVAAMFFWIAAAGVTLIAVAGGTAPAGKALPAAAGGGAAALFLNGLPARALFPALVPPVFVLFWLAGVAFMSLRTAAGLYGVLQLKRRGLEPLPAEWRERLGTWFREWGVQRAVIVRLSARVQTPVVAGFCRQVLLLPLAFFTTLPADQVKAILAHELAHFLRRDGLINLLQTLMETLFFFHPALWWISARMRVEREYCCDDYALEKCGRPIHLARALVELQSLGSRAAAPAPLLSATGALQTRIERLFTVKETTMDLREKLLALVILIGLGLVLVPLQGISKSLIPADDPKKKIEKIEVRVEKEGGDEKLVTVTTSDTSSDELDKMIQIDGEKGHRHVIKIKDGKPVSITRDGKEIPVDSLKKEMILHHLEDWEDDETPGVYTIETSGGDSTRKEIKLRIRKEGKEHGVWSTTAAEDKIVTVESSDDDSLHKVIRVKVVDASDSTGRHKDKDATHKRLVVVREPEHANKHLEEHDNLGGKIREELLKDGIIKSGSAVELRLTDKDFVVNGVKQPEAVRDKYKKLLGKRLGLAGKDKVEVKLNLQEQE